MRKFVPYIITAVVAAALAFAVSNFFSHSNILVSVADGEKAEWTKHYAGGRLPKGKMQSHHGSKWRELRAKELKRVDTAFLKLAVAKEKGLLTEEEYDKVVSVLIGPIPAVEGLKVDIEIETKITTDRDNVGDDPDE